MSILQNKLNVSDIREIMTFFYRIKDEICVEVKEEYFDTITEEDVTFLSKEEYLNKCNVKTKMKIFHMTFKIISLLMFNVFMKKNSFFSGEELFFDMQIYYERIRKETDLASIENKIQDLNKEEIIVAMRELYVDLLCLVSRKNSGTEFTPRNIVKFMFDSISYNGEEIKRKKLLEPACGSGIFLYEALKRIFNNFHMNYKEIHTLLVCDKIITGYDINPTNIFSTKLLLLCEIINSVRDISEKKLIELYYEIPIYCKNALKIENEVYDYIIGNPPYIRLQNLSTLEREYIKNNFESATGRFDLYVCFIEKAIKLLNKNGILSIITSNKYLTSNYGKGIRNYIQDNFDIDILFDLHDTKYFEASVLPAILTGHKNILNQNQAINYFHIKQNNNKNTISEKKDVFSIDFDKYKDLHFIKEHYTTNNGRFDIDIEFVYSKERLPDKNKQWNFGAKEDIEIKEYIENKNEYLLQEIADICVGVKSTADEVFVKPMTEKFIREKKLEKEIILPLLQQHNIKRWKIEWNKEDKNDRYILYVHELIRNKMKAIDLEKYPNVEKYLKDNEARLKSRSYLMESKTRKWYELWVPQSLLKFNRPKLITGDIASSNSFALDLSKRICQGNTFFITLKEMFIEQINISEIDYLKYLLGILNSEVMEFYQKSVSGSLYSKKYRYTTTNMNRWPIPKITNENIEIVNKIIENVDKIHGNINENIQSFEAELVKKVYELYKMPIEYQRKISEFLNTNR